MRLGVLSDRLNPTMREALDRIAARGVRVDLLLPRPGILRVEDLRIEHDLYLVKSGTAHAMSLAGALHALGAVTLNPFPTVLQLRNKIVVARILERAGVRAPRSFVCESATELAPLLAEGPLLLKPYDGSRGIGIRLLETPGDLSATPVPAPVFAQRYHRPDGLDHKIFRIGDELFGVRRRWPIRDDNDKLGEPFVVEGEMRELAMAIGEAFAIDLYGLDVIVSAGVPYVVDVNKFGSYMGVPEGARRVADYVVGHLSRLTR